MYHGAEIELLRLRRRCWKIFAHSTRKWRSCSRRCACIPGMFLPCCTLATSDTTPFDKWHRPPLEFISTECITVLANLWNARQRFKCTLLHWKVQYFNLISILYIKLNLHFHVIHKSFVHVQTIANNAVVALIRILFLHEIIHPNFFLFFGCFYSYFLSKHSACNLFAFPCAFKNWYFFKQIL